MAEPTASAVFARDELWALQACCRHEAPQQQMWKYPPANLELNEAIAEALLFLEDNGLTEVALTLTWEQCLAIDASVSQATKDANGKPLGRTILMKTFRIRHELRRSMPSAEAGFVDLIRTPQTDAQVKAALKEGSKRGKARHEATTTGDDDLALQA